MKAHNVSVSVVDMGGELYVNATFRLPGSLPSELSIREAARKAKQKAIKIALEDTEFTHDK